MHTPHINCSCGVRRDVYDARLQATARQSMSMLPENCALNHLTICARDIRGLTSIPSFSDFSSRFTYLSCPRRRVPKPILALCKLSSTQKPSSLRSSIVEGTPGSVSSKLKQLSVTRAPMCVTPICLPDGRTSTLPYRQTKPRSLLLLPHASTNASHTRPRPSGFKNWHDPLSSPSSCLDQA